MILMYLSSSFRIISILLVLFPILITSATIGYVGGVFASVFHSLKQIPNIMISILSYYFFMHL